MRQNGRQQQWSLHHQTKHAIFPLVKKQRQLKKMQKITSSDRRNIAQPSQKPANIPAASGRRQAPERMASKRKSILIFIVRMDRRPWSM
jgi:hypothetical protein